MGKSKQLATMLSDAPAALDTLDELAAALGDDANFATTVTNSIATKLDISNPVIDMGTNKKIEFSGSIGEVGSVPGFQARNDAGSGLRSMGLRGTSLRFATGSNERLRIDDGGRIGIGTTPNSNISASTFPGNISLGEQGVLLGNATSTQIGHNFYWNGSAFKYLGSGKASRIYQQSGEIVFQTTDDLGATDNNLTTMDTRLTINSVGNVSIGNAGNLTLSSAIGSNTSTAFGSMNGRISFDNDYSDTARGPNKIVLQNDTNWISGLGISNNYLDVYTGGNMRFLKSTDPNTYTENMVIKFDGSIGINNSNPVGRLDIVVPQDKIPFLVRSGGKSNIGYNAGHVMHCHTSLGSSGVWYDVCYVSHSPNIFILGSTVQDGSAHLGGSRYCGRMYGTYGSVTQSTFAGGTRTTAMNGGVVTGMDYRYLNSGGASGSYRLQVYVTWSGAISTMEVYTTVIGNGADTFQEDN